MKKLLLSAFLILLTSVCFAQDLYICVCPSDTVIEKYLTDTVKTVPASFFNPYEVREKREGTEILNLQNSLHSAYSKENSTAVKKAVQEISSYSYKDSREDFSIKIKKFDTSVFKDADLHDREILDYICRNSSSDMVVLNENRNLDSLNIRTLSIYNSFTGELTDLTTSVSSDSSDFSDRELKALLTYFGLIEETEAVEKKAVIEKNLELTSNVPSSVFSDSVYIGETPLVLSSYTLPLLLTFKAEGYRDSHLSLSEEKEKTEITLFPEWTENSLIYKNTSTRFYKSFAGFVLSIGLRAALLSAVPQSSSYYNTLDSVSKSLIVLSAGYMAYNLFDYYDFAYYSSKR